MITIAANVSAQNEKKGTHLMLHRFYIPTKGSTVLHTVTHALEGTVYQ